MQIKGKGEMVRFPSPLPSGSPNRSLGLARLSYSDRHCVHTLIQYFFDPFPSSQITFLLARSYAHRPGDSSNGTRVSDTREIFRHVSSSGHPEALIDIDPRASVSLSLPRQRSGGAS